MIYFTIRNLSRKGLQYYLQSVHEMGITALDLPNHDYYLPWGVSIEEAVSDWNVYWTTRWQGRLRYPLYPALSLSKVRCLPLRLLHPVQPTLSIPTLLEIISDNYILTEEDRLGLTDPYAAKIGNRYYIMNGHHRLWVQSALGETYTTIRVFNANYYLKRYPINLQGE